MTTVRAGGVRIRHMVRQDLVRVRQIAAGLKDAPQWTAAAYASLLDEAGAARRIALVAEAADGLVGFAVASMGGAQAELETVGVAQASQRLGLGARLLGALAGEMQAAGAEELFLEVRLSNQAAMRLYKGMGFRETGRRPCYYANPVEDAVVMVLRISG